MVDIQKNMDSWEERADRILMKFCEDKCGVLSLARQQYKLGANGSSSAEKAKGTLEVRDQSISLQSALAAGGIKRGSNEGLIQILV